MRSGLGGELMRAVSRFAMLGVVGGIGAGCSSDAMRFSDHPFSNPFSTPAQAGEPSMTGSIDKPRKVASLPTGQVRSEPLQPVRTPEPAIARAPAPQPVRPAPGGWSADGGTALTVKTGDTLTTIAERYGVPGPAILSTNSITSAQVTPGRRIIIPVYSTAAVRPVRATPAAAPVAALNPKPVAPAVKQAAAPVARPAPIRVAAAPSSSKPAAPKPVLAQAAPASTRPAKAIAAAEPVRAAARAPDPNIAALIDPKTTGSIEPKARPARPAPVLAAAAEPVQATNPGAAKPAPQPKAAKVEPPAKVAKPEAAATKTVKAEPAPAGKAGKAADAQKVAGKLGSTPTSPAPAPVPAKAPEAIAALQPAAPSAEFRWPARGRVISGFGGTGSNEGVNIAVPEGTPVKAAEAGTVAYAGSEVKGYGNLVLIKHENGYVSAYAHNGDLDVKRGQKVTRGQTIAKSGQTGNVTSPQIHFEIRKGSTPVDPMRYLASN